MPGFFSQKPNILTAVNLTGAFDTYFQAAAAAIFDAITNNRVPRTLVTNLLNSHGDNFKLLPPSSRLMRPNDRFNDLGATPELLSQLIRELAYTLRQLTIKELDDNPHLYTKVLSELKPENLQDPNFRLPREIFDALGNALNLSIVTKVVLEKKELPAKFTYGPLQKTPGNKIVIQLQEGHCIPLVMQAELFKKVKLIHSPELKPYPHLTLDTAVYDTAAKERELEMDVYSSHVKRLADLVNKDELSIDQLKEMYIQSIKPEVESTRSGTQYGLENYFAQSPLDKQRITIKFNSEGYQQQLAKTLIEGVARSITVGNLSEDIYDKIETLSTQYSPYLGG